MNTQNLPALSVANVAVRQHDGLYSLNDLHKASGGAKRHQPADFLKIEQTKALVAEIENSEDSRSLQTPKICAVKTKEGRNGGTFACRELVIAYAAWISPAFHLQVIRVFLDSVAAQVQHQPQPQLPLQTHPADLPPMHPRDLESPEPMVTLDTTTLYRISLVIQNFKKLHGIYRNNKVGQALAWLGSPVAAQMYDRFLDGMSNASALERLLGKDMNVARRYLREVKGINTGTRS